MKKLHVIIKFNQKAWLKAYIHINTKFRTEAKKLIMGKIFASPYTIQSLEKQWKMLVSIVKKLFSVRTKLSQSEVVFRKFIRN